MSFHKMESSDYHSSEAYDLDALLGVGGSDLASPGEIPWTNTWQQFPELFSQDETDHLSNNYPMGEFPTGTSFDLESWDTNMCPMTAAASGMAGENWKDAKSTGQFCVNSAIPTGELAIDDSTADPQPGLVDMTKEVKTRLPQPRILPEARLVLEEQYLKSRYPNSGELAVISNRTGLDTKRIRNWFSNTRARQADPVTVNDNSIFSIMAQDVPDTQMPLTRRSLEELSKAAELESQPQIEAWMSSGSGFSNLFKRGTGSEIPGTDTATRTNRLRERVSLKKQRRAKSVASSRASSGASSRGTNHSATSINSHTSVQSTRSRRRGRRRIESFAVPSLQQPSSWRTGLNKTDRPNRDENTFNCTFCFKSFKSQYEWTRHEETIHVPRTTWTCLSHTLTSLDDCPFCGIAMTSNHLRTHNWSMCVFKDKESRTFFRKDQFIQHLHAVHYPGIDHPSLEHGCKAGSGFGCSGLTTRWQSTAPALAKDDIALHCGFCGHWLATWEERRSHVSAHFKVEKLKMSAWWSERAPPDLQGIRTPTGWALCLYCRETFNQYTASGHSTCQVWSCRYLKDRQDLNLVDINISDSRGSILFPTLESFQNYRNCDQALYTSRSFFFYHLVAVHGAHGMHETHKLVLDKHFSSVQPAVFEALENNGHFMADGQHIMELQRIQGSLAISPVTVGPCSPSTKGVMHTSEQAQKYPIGMDDLADTLDKTALGEILERDNRRRQKKRRAEEERLKRRLERRAEKQEANK